jgi:hypothetical protein
MDAAGWFDCRSGLWRAAVMGLGTLGKVPEAQDSGSSGDDQKHHHRGNPEFGSARHYSNFTLLHI